MNKGRTGIQDCGVGVGVQRQTSAGADSMFKIPVGVGAQVLDSFLLITLPFTYPL